MKNTIAIVLASIGFLGATASLIISGIMLGQMAKPGADAEITTEKFAAYMEEYQAYMQEQQAAAEQAAAKESEELVLSDNYGIGNAPMKGSADAPIKIVEFTEYECPYCQRHALQTLPELQKYIDDGTVAYYVRDFIIHGDSAIEKAQMAECARVQGGDEAYFKAHDFMFEEFGTEYTSADVAKAAGVNASKLAQCVESEETINAVNEDIEAGTSYGVTGTPGFFVNGYFIRGAYPFSEFERVINEKLAEMGQ